MSSTVQIRSTGTIQYPIPEFEMRGARININTFLPRSKNYQPNAWSLLKQFNINTICVSGGVEGDIAHFNIDEYPGEWAQNLDAFLAEADSHDIKVYFLSLGQGWGTLFGIICPGDVGPLNYTSIWKAKQMIDKLAGDNPLGHNFLSDPRVVGWRSSNEVDIEDSFTLRWNIEICDYIRARGGKVWLSSPRLGSFAKTGFDYTRPLIEGHVDYLEMHLYGVWELIHLFDRDWDAFSAWYRDNLQKHMMDARGSFSVDELILGEFGIWRGNGTDLLTTASFTDEEREIYYNIVLSAARDVGIKNVVFHNFFVQVVGPDWSTRQSPQYGVVDIDGSLFSVSNIIKNYYK